MSEKILIVGTGALATLFAFQLSKAGIDVTVLGNWQDGLNALRDHGARLNGDIARKVRATDNPNDCGRIKFAIILVKSWQTEHAAQMLKDCLEIDGLAITLQNGLGNHEILSGTLGSRRVFRGVTTLGAALLAPGRVRSSGSGTITIEANERLKAFTEILRIAYFDVNVVDDLYPVIWGKLLINACINPLTALLRVRNGGLLEIPPAHELLDSLAGEVASVAKGLDVKLPFTSPLRAVEDVARDTSENISSMLQDVLRGAPTEIDSINGEVIRAGKRRNIPTPINQVVWLLVKANTLSGRI